MKLGIDYQVIGGRIRKAREDKSMTQAHLAEFLDVSNAYISKIERGRTAVNLNHLDKICAVLDTSVEFILNGTSKASPSYLRNEITEMLQDCTPDQIKLITQIIRIIISQRDGAE